MTSPRRTAAWSRCVGESVVRLLIERDGRRILRALDGCCPERTVDAGNETHIRGVVVFESNTFLAPAPPRAPCA